MPKKYLSLYDMEVALPIIADAIVSANGKPLKNFDLRKILLKETNKYYPASSVIRMIVHEIRTKDIVKNIIAGAAGYWISDNAKEVQEYIDSLQLRAISIHEVQGALKRQMGDTLIGQLKIPELCSKN